jgi:DNA relaxase NicK
MVNSTAQKVMTRVDIQWQDQFGRWQRFQEKHNQADAFRTAQARARSTGKRHRLVDANGQLLDLVEP